MIWHSNTAPDVLQELQVDVSVGLTQQEAANRLKEYGKNSLQEQTSISFRQALSKQIRTPLTALLWILASVALLIDAYRHFLKNTPTDWKRSLIVAAVALVITLLHTIRHCRAATSMATLRSLSVPEARVRRDGTEQTVSALTLVPGDIVLLRMGDLVPADCRIVEAHSLRCDECELTEATMPTEKYAEATFDDITPLAQRTNMLYAGTAITAGTATAVVVATGVRSEMGHRPTKFVQTSLPMQRLADRLTLWMSVVVACFSILYLVIGLICHEDDAAVLLMAGALAMAAAPQGIASLFTLLSTRSIRRMSSHHLLLNRPEVADTLGHVTVVCTEQETLFTENKVILERAYIGTQSIPLCNSLPKVRGVVPFMRLAVLNSTEGHPVDDAILSIAAASGIHRNELLTDMPRIGELTPSAQRRTGVHLAGEQTLILVSGDWRSLLPLCTKSDIENLTKEATAMEADCLQVMVVAYRLTDSTPAVYTADELERDLTCAGLLGWCRPWQLNLHQTADDLSNVRYVLFSDESVTAAGAVAQQAGLSKQPRAITADEVSAFTDSDWDTAVKQYDVYCGLNAQQKEQVVAALQRQGEVVAVTAGDSREADLLTAADVGFARGTVAADVTKEAADIILTDDSYIALLSAVYEGQRLRRERTGLVSYLILCASIVMLIGLCSLFGLFSPAVGTLPAMGLHLLLLALPTPLWVATLISNISEKLRKG